MLDHSPIRNGDSDRDSHDGCDICSAYAAGRDDTRSLGSKMYAVSARVERQIGDWSHVAEMPTFYLLADVQGIVSEDHATRIARKMFESLGFSPAAVHVCAVETSTVAH